MVARGQVEPAGGVILAAPSIGHDMNLAYFLHNSRFLAQNLATRIAMPPRIPLIPLSFRSGMRLALLYAE